MILLTHDGLVGFGGTETYMLTVAEQLQRTGHEVAVFAPNLGPMADFSESRGVRVIGSDQLPDRCELVLAQDAGTCLEMASRYPKSKRIYVAHSNIHMLQTPPQQPGVYDALVVLNERMYHWAKSLAHTERIVRLRQPVDLNRFRLGPQRQLGPPRVLVLSGYLFGSRAEHLAEACRRAGVELSWLEGQTATPEVAIAGAEIVIGLGRSALEAMASSRAVLVFGPLGGDGWVVPEKYERLEADGFTGRATDLSLDADALAEQFAGWDPVMGNVNRDLVSRHHDVRDHASRLIALAEALPDRGPHERASGYGPELARLVRLEWQRSADLTTARREISRLAAEAEQRAQENARLRSEQVALARTTELLTAQEAHASALAAHNAILYQEVVSTRRWRLACAVSRPLDGLRARLQRARG